MADNDGTKRVDIGSKRLGIGVKRFDIGSETDSIGVKSFDIGVKNTDIRPKTDKFGVQNYIHKNSVLAGIVQQPKEYLFTIFFVNFEYSHSACRNFCQNA